MSSNSKKKITAYGLINKKTGVLVKSLGFAPRSVLREFKKNDETVTKFEVFYKEVARGQ